MKAHCHRERSERSAFHAPEATLNREDHRSNNGFRQGTAEAVP
jgi:hypothetical protein